MWGNVTYFQKNRIPSFGITTTKHFVCHTSWRQNAFWRANGRWELSFEACFAHSATHFGHQTHLRWSSRHRSPTPSNILYVHFVIFNLTCRFLPGSGKVRRLQPNQMGNVHGMRPTSLQRLVFLEGHDTLGQYAESCRIIDLSRINRHKYFPKVGSRLSSTSGWTRDSWIWFLGHCAPSVFITLQLG